MRPRSVICDQWTVALVPFPFMEVPASKRRPALVLSSKAFNQDNGHSIFAMITTAKATTWPSDYLLQKPIEVGLTQNCYVRWKTFTLPNDLIIKELGPLAAADWHAVKAHWEAIFAIGSVAV
jgi:mRNA interferase MazF